MINQLSDDPPQTTEATRAYRDLMTEIALTMLDVAVDAPIVAPHNPWPVGCRWWRMTNNLYNREKRYA